MQLSKSRVFIITLLLSLTACGSSKENYTSEYLYENDEIRTQVLQDCKENKQSQDNCNNAQIAKSKKFSETSPEKKVQQWQ